MYRGEKHRNVTEENALDPSHVGEFYLAIGNLWQIYMIRSDHIDLPINGRFEGDGQLVGLAGWEREVGSTG